MLTWTFVIITNLLTTKTEKNPHEGREFKYYTVTTPAGLWKVREVLQVLTGDVVRDLKFEKKNIVGKVCRIQIEDDEYNGVQKSKMSGVFEI